MADIDERHRQALEQRRRRAERNNANNNLDGNSIGSKILSGIEGAIVTKSAIALLYRSGAAPAAMRGLNFGAKFLSRMTARPEFSKNVRDWTISDVRALKNASKDIWKDSRGELSGDSVHIDTRNQHSFLGMLARMQEIKGNKGNQILAEGWKQEGLLNPTIAFINRYAKHIGNNDINMIRRYQNFAEKLTSNLHSAVSVRGLIHNSGFDRDPQQEVYARAIVKYMRKRDNYKARDAYAEKFRKADITNLLDDMDAIEKQYGKGKPGKNKWLYYLNHYEETITGTHKATVKDLFANKDKIRSTITYSHGEKGSVSRYDAMDLLQAARDHYAALDAKNLAEIKKGADASKYRTDYEKRFMNLVVDDAVRIDKYGVLYSTQGLETLKTKALDSFADTIPGKIFKLRDFAQARTAPQIVQLFRGTNDPFSAAILNKDKNVSVLDRDVTIANGKAYEITENGDFRAIDTNGDFHLYNNWFGARKRLLKQMSGNVRYKEQSNPLLHWLGLFEDREDFFGEGILERVKSVIHDDANEDDINNIIDKLTHPNREMRDTFDFLTSQDLNELHQKGWTPSEENLRYLDTAIPFLSRINKLHDWMAERTYELGRETAEKLSQNVEDETAKSIFEHIANDNLEELENFTVSLKEAEGLYSDNTQAIAAQLLESREEFESSIHLKVDRTRAHVGSDYVSPITTGYGQEAETPLKRLQYELSKEAALHLSDSGGWEKVFQTIDDAGLKGKEKFETERLFHLSRLEAFSASTRGPIPNQSSAADEFEFIVQDATGAASAFMDDEVGTDLKTTLEQMKKEHHGPWDVSYEAPDEIGNPLHTGLWGVMRSVKTPLDVLRNLNDWTKFKSSIGRLGGQLFAGRDELGEVTEATMAPYFMLSRLSDELNKVGVGLAPQDMGSTADMLKAFALKRILPVALGGTYFEWADDTSQELTGMSITGAAAQGVAEFDIASRRVLDTFGITDWLKGEKAINPIMQYWGGHDEFQSADERRKWYESGYEPVRKGAWWTFGGVNEARGSEIQYWSPTWVRRIQSDYKDKSLYNGYFDKWSHSLLPTPSNPLSPIEGILDPYGLEERLDSDRPFDLTGHMFEDSTPWGAVLNNTIGDIIKPQKDLHTIGSWLPFTDGFHYRNINGIDPLSLMHAINQEIKQKARDLGGRNYIQIGAGDQFTPVDIDEYNAPTEDSRVLSFNYKNGKYADTREGSYGVYSPGNGIPGRNGRNALGNGQGSGSSTISSKTLTDPTVLDKINQGNHISLREAADYYFFGGPAPTQDHLLVKNSKGGAAMWSTVADMDAIRKARNLPERDKALIDELASKNSLHVETNLQSLLYKINPKAQIAALNNEIRDKANNAVADNYISPNEFDAEEGIVHGDKLKGYRPSTSMELLNDPDTINHLSHIGKGNDLVQEAAVSWRLISGIYGYAIGEATGFGVDNKKRIATGQDMTSFSRSFWDENYGGFGGSVMEIARRFIPDYRRSARINPLMNTMPDWLPDRFRYGDPFVAIPRGEMRLPGKGYESLNELHGDQYGRYGAFDRMKILADIAPFSPEYRLWRDIAKKTVTDPELIDEMAEIRDRVNQQGKKHDFYNYKVVGHGLEYKNVVVSEVLGYGRFRSGNTIYKVAGAHIHSNAEESMKDVLGRYIHPGQDITVAVDEDDYNRRNNDTVRSVDAAVFIDGQNIGQEMIKNGDATIRKGDNSAAAVLADYGPIQRAIAYGSEFIAHLDVPWLSDQFLRVRSPLESYKAEQVYGTPYQSWSHPIDSFLMPAIERATHDRSVLTSGLGMLYHYIDNKPGVSKWNTHLAVAAYLLGDRGAFIGAALSNLLMPGKGSAAMKGAQIGSMAMTLTHALSGGNNYVDEMSSTALIGYHVSKFMEKNRKWGALIGAGVGFAYRTLFGPKLGEDWIPERTRKKWEIQDYFDRLTYIKYSGLYHQAALKAKKEEDVDIEDVLDKRAEEEEKNHRAVKYFESLKKRLQSNAEESPLRKQLISRLNQKIDILNGEKMVLPGGEWTRTALLYKQARDSTVYALKKNSSWSQIVSALPTNDREYFMEFVKERNPDNRAKILRYVSPSLQKALKLAWGQKPDKEKTNERFFRDHELPSAKWAGWAPQVDLKNVEVKTIKNEAAMLADFGFYDSQERDPKVINAPTARFSGTSKSHNSEMVSQNLKKALEGAGLHNVDISVMPGPSGGGNSIKAAIKTMLGMRDVQRQVNDQVYSQTQR